MTPVNSEYFASIRAQIEATNNCADLQRLATDALAPVYEIQEKILAEQAKLQALLALLEPPDLGSIVTWVQDFITGFLTPYVQPYYDYVVQLAALSVEVASIIAALEAKMAEITSCEIILPPPPDLTP